MGLLFHKGEGRQSLDHKAQLRSVLALASVIQEGLEPLAQIFGRCGRSALQQCRLDVVAADIDLLQP